MTIIYDASGYASGAVELPHDDDYDIGPVVALEHVTKRLRRKARAHERLSRLRGHKWVLAWFDWSLARYHEGAADALEAMAERIERGDV